MKNSQVERIEQSELESYLWNAAVLLRGLIDAGDYKGYIFPLIFLKRISDVWDEERQIALSIYGSDLDVELLEENHRFVVPTGAHWNDIRSTTNNIGQKIVQAMRTIEAANGQSLVGVFGDSDWTNKNLLSDAVLTSLVEHFSSKELSLRKLPEDELGNGYEFLIKRFADDSGHTAQEFYTNRTLVHLMTRMLDPRPGDSIYDPTCGTGGMLISCVAELKNQGKEFRSLRLFGQEMNYTTASIAKMNLFLHGIEDGHIGHGDTLSNPKFVASDGSLQTFDIVLANPPYSIKNWNRDLFANDQFGRNLWGLPPQGRADYAFFQHVAKSMNAKTGRAAILFPHGVLFRKEEKALRQRLVESGMLETVLGLGGGLFYNSPMEAVVVILNNQRSTEQRRSVQFINAVDYVTKSRNSSNLSVSQQTDILDMYRNKIVVSGVSYLAKIEEIAANEWTLTIPMYVLPIAESTEDQIQNNIFAKEALNNSAKAVDKALSELIKILQKKSETE